MEKDLALIESDNTKDEEDRSIKSDIANMILRISNLKQIPYSDARDHLMLQALLLPYEDAVTLTKQQNLQRVTSFEVDDTTFLPNKRISTLANAYRSVAVVDNITRQPQTILPTKTLASNFIRESSETKTIGDYQEATQRLHGELIQAIKKKKTDEMDPNTVSEDEMSESGSHLSLPVAPLDILNMLNKLYKNTKKESKNESVQVVSANRLLGVKLFSLSAGIYDRYVDPSSHNLKDFLASVSHNICKDWKHRLVVGPNEKLCLTYLDSQFQANNTVYYFNGINGRPDAVKYGHNGLISSVAEFKSSFKITTSIELFASGQLYFYMKATKALDGYLVLHTSGPLAEKVNEFEVKHFTEDSIKELWQKTKREGLDNRIKYQKKFYNKLLNCSSTDLPCDIRKLLASMDL